MQGSLRVLNGVSWRVFALTVCQIVVASAGRGACAAWAATTDASVLGATQYGADTKIFSSGTDGGLWQLVWNGSGPTEIPGTAGSLTSAPIEAVHGSTLDVYWRGGDGGLNYVRLSGSSWSRATERIAIRIRDSRKPTARLL